MKRLLVCLLLLIAFIAITPEADACSPIEPGWFPGIPEQLGQVPIEGVILLPAQFVSPFGNPDPANALDGVTVTVRAADRTPVPGQLEHAVGLAGVLWRSNAPLAPGAMYTLTYDFDSAGTPNGWTERSGEARLTTRTTALGPLSPSTISDLTLGEQSHVARWECCEADLVACATSCGTPDVCERCAALEFAHTPILEAQIVAGPALESATEILRHRILVRAPNGEVQQAYELAPRMEIFSVRAESSAGTGQHCLRIETERVVDGATVTSEWTCIDDAQRVPAERVGMKQSLDTSICEGPVYEKDIDGGLFESSAGCRCSTPLGASPVAALGVLLGLGLFARRRRLS